MRRFFRPLGEQGFTIMELMIATTVVSVILLISTVSITGIGNLYYKGANQAQTQDTARTITDDLATRLQMSQSISPAPAATEQGQSVQAFCVNSNIRYTYLLDWPIQTPVGAIIFPHIMWRDTLDPGQPCVAADLSQTNPSATTGGSNGTEMVGGGDRLTALCIGTYSGNSCTSPNFTSPYTVTVGVAFGDPTLTTGSGTGTACNDTNYDRFCATASLSTVVAKRIN